MRRRAPLLLALLASAAPPAAHAAHGPEQVVRLTDLTVVEKTEIVALAARNGAELAAALREHGLDQGDSTRGAYVWRLDWDFRTAADRKHGCRVAGGEVKLTSVTVQPQWQPPKAGTELARDWARYTAALRAHVQKHKDLTVTRARQLRPKLLKLHAKDCAALERAIRYFGETADQDLRAQNDDLDRRAQHGAADGWRWPPDRKIAAPAPPRAAQKP